jgi:hypothetical protein
MSINQGDRVRISNYAPNLNGKKATVTASNRKGYYLRVDNYPTTLYLSNLEGINCLDKLTSAQESGLDLPSQVYEPDLISKDLPKSIHSVQKYSNLDTPESPTMATSNNGKRGRGRPRKESISLPLVLPVNPSATKETASDNKTPEIVSPTSETSLKKSNPRTGRSKTSPAYSASIGETILDSQSSTGLTTAGMMSNGSLLAQDILEAPILEKDFLYLESPGALGEGISGANPPGQNKLEGQLKEIGSIAPGEVSNPEFLEKSLGLPVGWTDPQETATATEFLAKTEPIENAAKPSEISLTPELPNSPSIASSTTIPKHSTRTGIFAPELPKQLDLTSRIAWVYVDQIEEVSCTQIRHSVDGEAIARYAELMRDNLWDFQRHPLPVLFEHENRYLIGDGHHRIEAARKHKVQIKCEIFTAWSIEDALLYSIRAVENLNHGIPLRPKDQRKRITMFLDLLDEGKISIVPPEGFQEWSARAIATYLRLPESGYRTVASIRKERAKVTEEPWESWGITPPDDTTPADTSTPPPIDTPADTYTPLSTFIPAEITTPPPSFIPADTSTPVNTPPLPTPPARLAAMVVVILDKIDELNHEQLIELKEAIAAEEVRRLGKILEEELVLSEVEVKGSN